MGDDLLAGAAQDESGMTTRAAASHDNKVGFLLERRSEQRCHGIAVDDETAVDDCSVDERSAPLLLEQGDHLAPEPHRWHERPVVEVCQQAQGVHSDDLCARAFDEGCCPFEGAR